jgi:ABC-type transport system involved in cytochrome c biogenesis ATPase subunit
MQIKEIKISSAFEGLASSRMERLSQKVVIAGPNGSGKSRLLRTVSTLASSWMPRADVEIKEAELRQFEENIANYTIRDGLNNSSTFGENGSPLQG